MYLKFKCSWASCSFYLLNVAVLVKIHSSLQEDHRFSQLSLLTITESHGKLDRKAKEPSRSFYWGPMAVTGNTRMLHSLGFLRREKSWQPTVWGGVCQAGDWISTHDLPFMSLLAWQFAVFCCIFFSFGKSGTGEAVNSIFGTGEVSQGRDHSPHYTGTTARVTLGPRGVLWEVINNELIDWL